MDLSLYCKSSAVFKRPKFAFSFVAVLEARGHFLFLRVATSFCSCCENIFSKVSLTHIFVSSITVNHKFNCNHFFIQATVIIIVLLDFIAIFERLLKQSSTSFYNFHERKYTLGSLVFSLILLV